MNRSHAEPAPDSIVDPITASIASTLRAHGGPSWRLTALMTAMPAASAEVSYDFVACTHGVNRVLEGSPELTALGSESWGIVASSTTKEWESATTRGVGHLRIAGGKTVGKGLCRWVQASGDTPLGE